ncbi:hypothetical protein WJX82_007172 [Trebouxia sp. C0006]
MDMYTSRCKLANGVRPLSIGRTDRRSILAVVSALPVGEVAALPSLIPVLLRAFSAGLLLYSSLAWASARSDRKQVEQNIENIKSQKAEQKAKLDRLRGTSDTDNKQ